MKRKQRGGMKTYLRNLKTRNFIETCLKKINIAILPTKITRRNTKNIKYRRKSELFVFEGDVKVVEKILSSSEDEQTTFLKY